ncbi:MAG: YHS domain-containing protein [Phycisphaerales bacterium]|nr:MAG: YHS domain-containing protein [Phycisphaerales bacterium]
MNGGTKRITALVVLASLLLLTAFGPAGCKKKSEPAPEPNATAQGLKDAVAGVAEQTTCPVMEGPINKDIFVEHEGQKVYFCCEPCKEKFQADPEQYIAKLPQFKK